MTRFLPEGSELGKKSSYEAVYNPELLFPIARVGKRSEIGIDSNQLPFYGFDCWNHYEVSCLNLKGKPIVAVAQIIYDCRSPMIIESKSMKLYFNSLNNSKFESIDSLRQTIEKDLAKAVQSGVAVVLSGLQDYPSLMLHSQLEGESLDELDVECSEYSLNSDLLSTNKEIVTEILCSDLLKSNCLVTYQPDWGSVQISYTGKKINREGLLKYLVSFRNHNEFHEQCIERIFVDIMRRCEPSELTVHGCYTRRGGLDINPYRSTLPADFQTRFARLVRQ
jgi:7-cyano-7-deazaguanine reductase